MGQSQQCGRYDPQQEKERPEQDSLNFYSLPYQVLKSFELLSLQERRRRLFSSHLPNLKVSHGSERDHTADAVAAEFLAWFGDLPWKVFEVSPRQSLAFSTEEGERKEGACCW
jgi:hypothetical protein